MVDRWIHEGVARGRVEIFEELVMPDVVDRSGPTATTGVATFKARAAAVHMAFADLEGAVDDLVIDTRGDRIAWRWTLTGIHKTPLFGILPSNARVALRGMNIQRLDGARVAEHWSIVDRLAIREQLDTPANAR